MREYNIVIVVLVVPILVLGCFVYYLQNRVGTEEQVESNKLAWVNNIKGSSGREMK